jgi:hypothetical protein
MFSTNSSYIQSGTTSGGGPLHRVMALLLLIAASACEVYDSRLLEAQVAFPLAAPSECGDGLLSEDELCDSAMDADSPGACPSSCDAGQACMPQVMIGSGCTRRCVYRFITTARDADGCCPPLAAVEQDSDCRFCGDGLVSDDETCDPADGCPSEDDCTSDDPCVISEFSGAGALCSARCETRRVEQCRDGDSCCADGCSNATDTDCPATCGDGEVDASLGETCDPVSPEHPCAPNCDDSDPCTEDVMTGAPGSCDVACSHREIAKPDPDDNCCPPGADASDDSDCEPECGNGVVEGDEQCDQSEDCTDDCQSMAAAEPDIAPTEPAGGDSEGDRCSEVSVPDISDACQRCVCNSCPEVALDCYDSGDEQNDRACGDLVACGQSHGCYDYSCYCGDGVCVPPTGPCRAETEAAAGSTSLVTILRCYEEPQCTNYRARALGQCVVSNCEQECQP